MKKLSREKTNRINELIPLAAAEADKYVENNNLSPSGSDAEWSRVYHSTMDKLAKEQGLRV